MGRNRNIRLRRFHEAKWDEELIFELSVGGERGILVPMPSEEMISQVGDVAEELGSMRRTTTLGLPEVGQMRVNRHYMRLSQETLGADVTPDISQGTCTMKYSPKVQEHLTSRNPKLVALHPLQDPSTMQGLLEIYHETEKFVCEISGMDHFSFQPGGGAQACYTGASMIRAYHEERGEGYRNEVVTTMLSHPADAGAPATAGYKVTSIMPNEDGLPDLEAFKAALSEKTAAVFMTNPEDTGIFNSKIKDYVEAAHAVGAICYYDQANVNGIMGFTRAKESGFDIIHYNLHKTFSAPHGGMGPGVGAIGCLSKFEKYLPSPREYFKNTLIYGKCINHC